MYSWIPPKTVSFKNCSLAAIASIHAPMMMIGVASSVIQNLWRVWKWCVQVVKLQVHTCHLDISSLALEAKLIYISGILIALIVLTYKTD
jgi:hypothetical protein